MANYNKLTESKFKAIKILLQGGATYEETAEYMQVGTSCVYKVKCAESWQDYLQANAARAIADKKKRAKEAAEKVGAVPAATLAKEEEKPVEVVKEVRQSVTIQATHYMMQEMQRTNELLAQISAKLAYIVEDLYGTGKKEG
jgi:transposase-like protein